jgi:hypothetical protein
MARPLPLSSTDLRRPASPWTRLAFISLLALALVTHATGGPPHDGPPLPLSELAAGDVGEVWTVFQGTTPEPFSVEVTGVIRNALGPAKSLILCRLTDPRVQTMGAVAGMSGSPLYIRGRLAGALSYQVQRFETVRYAGFTPVADLEEVAVRMSELPLVPIPLEKPSVDGEAARTAGAAPQFLQPLTPVFTLSGLAPAVAERFLPQLRAVGIEATVLGGSAAGGPQAPSNLPTALNPGDAVAVALAVGDITIAGTGTVSQVNGRRITAFGHPMLGIGDVALPLCASEIVAILPSNLNSMKVSNTGPVIGTLLQDRLSAVAGELGPGPQLIPVDVETPQRSLRFAVARHPQLAPMAIAMGVTQAVQGTNDAGFAEGFRVVTRVDFPGQKPLEMTMLYPGPQGFAAGVDEFLQKLNAGLQNPFERTFPASVRIRVERLGQRPWAYLDTVQPSSTRLQPGDTLTVLLSGRDHQGAAIEESVSCPIPANWIGRTLELVVLNGRELDRATGQAASLSASDVRSFSAYLDGLRSVRRPDGLYVAVLERTAAVLDQNERLVGAPGSIERITQGALDTRYGRQDVAISLWEQHVMSDRLISAQLRRGVIVTD